MILKLEDQQNIKPIDQNNWGKYPQIAKEVEESKLRELLGIALLQDIQKNPTSANNKLLLNGDTYTDCNDVTITHLGLKYVIAYLNYSHYVGISYVADTFTGMVKKSRQDAETLSNGEILRIQNDNRSIALTEWENIKEYLNQNTDKFHLWKNIATPKLYAPKFYNVRKTRY